MKTDNSNDEVITFVLAIFFIGICVGAALVAMFRP